MKHCDIGAVLYVTLGARLFKLETSLS